MTHKINIKPLSINSAYQGRRFRTPKYDNFIKTVLNLLPKTLDFPNPKNIKLAIEFGYSSKLSDCDNGLKPFIDCLVKKYKVDDRYIYEIHVFKNVVNKGDEYIKFKVY